jgi:ribokinase
MTARPPAVVVVGSLNTDHVVRVDHLPASGETVTGSDYLVVPGGKGLNQAIAAARQGVSVAFVGCVGADGSSLVGLLESEGVDVSHVRVIPDTATGVALVTVASGGANTVVVAPMANGLVSTADIDAASSVIAGAAVVLAQLEVPLVAVSALLVQARAAGVLTVLNPAPASGPLPASLLGTVDILIPNETEAAALTGLTDCPSAALALRGSGGAGSVIVTMGSEGAVVAGTEVGSAAGEAGQAAAVDEAVVRRVAPFAVRAVDTTAAGDAFCGTLVAALAGGASLSEACRRGSAAGALATTVVGAVPSLPTAAMVDGLLGS